MKFGISLGFRNPEPWQRPYPEVYAEGLGYARLAEQLGYDSAWITEHHFMFDGYCPAPLVAATAVATQTRRVIVGTKILILPLHHPLRVAEDGAVLDIISDGRFHLGVGIGYRQEEFDGFGFPMRQRAGRLEEGLEVVRQAWTQDRVTFHGRYFQLDAVPVVPRPVQQPHPPIWIGAFQGPAIERAARLGYPLILGGGSEGYREYQAALRACGRDPADFEIIHSRTIHVDEDGERARREAAPGITWTQWRPIGQLPPREAIGPDLLVPTSAVFPRGALVGSPEEVLEELLRNHAELPIMHLTFHAQIPGLPRESVERSLELFMRKVAPRLAAATAPAGSAAG